MADSRKIVLHSLTGYSPKLATFVAGWISEGVKYVGVVGVDASRIEDAIDELCIGDGSEPYFMLTASHDADETLEDAMFLAEHVSEDVGTGPVEVVTF